MENQTQDQKNDVAESIVTAQPKKLNFLIIPIIIVLIISAILFILIKAPTNKNSQLAIGGLKFDNAKQAEQKLNDAKNQANIPDQKLLPTDHTQGNINARIVVFEYSDLDCPYCVKFHPTMKQLVVDYPNDVLWVYRHFPLDGLHPAARDEAKASECVAKLAGNSSFWNFIDKAFAFNSSATNEYMPTLTDFAKNLGVDQTAFENCIKSPAISSIITDQQNLAIKSGAEGTPYSIILDRKTGAIYPAPGAQDLDTMREIVKTILNDK